MIDFKKYMDEVKNVNPLVMHMTNYVTVNDCANMCICSHGSPVMTDAKEDVEDMLVQASSVVINPGTLNERTVESMFLAGYKACEEDIPIVFDPVGAGATPYRTDFCRRFLSQVGADVIKGNIGEIGFLSGIGGVTKGVDSVGASGDIVEAVRRMALDNDCIVAATGEKDYVSDGDVVYELSNGSPMMETVSGTGCMLSSVLASYVGANGPVLDAVVTAICMFNVASELAAKDAPGPGTFKARLFDNVYSMDPGMVEKMARLKML